MVPRAFLGLFFVHSYPSRLWSREPFSDFSSATPHGAIARLGSSVFRTRGSSIEAAQWPAWVAKGNKIIFDFVHLCPSTVLGLLFVHMALPGAPEPDVSTGPTSLGECEVYFRGFLACTKQSLKSKLEATAYVGQLEWARRKVQYLQNDKSCIDKELRTACKSMRPFVNFFFKRLGSEGHGVEYRHYTG